MSLARLSARSMKAESLKHLMLNHAEEIRRLHARIHETMQLRERSPEHHREWQLACQAFNARYDALAFPGGYWGALERIAAGEPEAVEAALVFLEVRPYFYRPGYMFKDILSRMKRAELHGSQARRFAQIVEAWARYRAGRRRN